MIYNGYRYYDDLWDLWFSYLFLMELIENKNFKTAKVILCKTKKTSLHVPIFIIQYSKTYSLHAKLNTSI